MDDQLIASRSQYLICFGEILCHCLSLKPFCCLIGDHERHPSFNQASSHQQVNLWSGCWSRLLHCLSFNGGGLACLILNAFFSLLSSCLFITSASHSAVVVKMYCGTPFQHHGAVRSERKLIKTLFAVTTVSLLLFLLHIIFFFRSFLNVSSAPTNLFHRSSLPRNLNFVLFFLY